MLAGALRPPQQQRLRPEALGVARLTVAPCGLGPVRQQPGTPPQPLAAQRPVA